MLSTQYYKGTNKIYSWHSVSRKCKECKHVKLWSVTCENSIQLVTIYQFEIVESQFKKVDKKSGKDFKKTSTRTEWVSGPMKFK